MPRIVVTHKKLTRKLGVSVDAERIRCVIFPVWGGFAAVKNIIRADVYQRNIHSAGGHGHIARTDGVHSKGLNGLSFALVDITESSGVDHQFGADALQGTLDRSRIADLNILVV